MSELDPARVRLHQECVMSPWLFNIYADDVIREVNARMFSRGLSLVNSNDIEWKINQLLFAVGTVLVADSKEKLYQLMEKFG